MIIAHLENKVTFASFHPIYFPPSQILHMKRKAKFKPQKMSAAFLGSLIVQHHTVLAFSLR